MRRRQMGSPQIAPIYSQVPVGLLQFWIAALGELCYHKLRLNRAVNPNTNDYEKLNDHPGRRVVVGGIGSAGSRGRFKRTRHPHGVVGLREMFTSHLHLLPERSPGSKGRQNRQLLPGPKFGQQRFSLQYLHD